MKPDGDTSAQGPVHPTPACDFQKPLTLGHIQVAYQFNGSVNGVHLLEGDFTVRGMRRVRPVVAEPDTNVL